MGVPTGTQQYQLYAYQWVERKKVTHITYGSCDVTVFSTLVTASLMCNTLIQIVQTAFPQC